MTTLRLFLSEIEHINDRTNFLSNLGGLVLDENKANKPLSEFKEIIDEWINMIVDNEEEYRNDLSEEDNKNFLILAIYVIDIKFADANKPEYTLQPNPKEIVNKIIRKLSRFIGDDPERKESLDSIQSRLELRNDLDWYQLCRGFSVRELEIYGF